MRGVFFVFFFSTLHDMTPMGICVHVLLIRLTHVPVDQS